ncbi:SDR family NAD(P)-dependent oxidoreductase [Shewanella waksmanii]|uniref:SDR family NAD(P)-dependent oxidoreductase n=1 Tax=Shewanella waksmanii TaxID=213783 RepID=UPI0004BA9933|nr:SDR family NAD(P)-dependent oxidoreductase [Shewanella waksmanii]
MTANSPIAVVIGASSEIAQATIAKLRSQQKVIAISRHRQRHPQPNVCDWQCDYSEASIVAMTDLLTEVGGDINRVYIFNGVLHHSDQFPGKRVEDIDATAMLASFQSNSVVPILWLKHLLPVLSGKQVCSLTVMSARVGSISDNHLGGWYSYRASKAALNMLIQTAGIEYARRAKNVALLCFHPGTTDTALSKPFQSNVPAGKLFSTDFVAQQLLYVSEHVHPICGAHFLDWQGNKVDW